MPPRGRKKLRVRRHAVHNAAKTINIHRAVFARRRGFGMAHFERPLFAVEKQKQRAGLAVITPELRFRLIADEIGLAIFGAQSRFVLAYARRINRRGRGLAGREAEDIADEGWRRCSVGCRRGRARRKAQRKRRARGEPHACSCIHVPASLCDLDQLRAIFAPTQDIHIRARKGSRVSKRYDVAGIGNAIVDVIHPASDGFLLEHNIAKGVMTLIDEFRAEQLVAALREGRTSSGGSAANTMAGLASFGGRGYFVGKVKNDRLGQSFSEDLRAIGVDFDTAMGLSGPSTACCIIAVTPDGQRSMNTYLGACRELTPADIDTASIADAGILYIEGYLWDAEESKAAIRKAIAAAKQAGAKVAFTLSDPFCVGRFRSEFLQLMQGDVDILFANEDEIKALYEVDAFDDALQRARAWHGLAAMTRSAKGCVIASPSGEVHVLEAEKISQVIDTTGAGDQFAAGFLFGHARGRNLRDCGRLGAIAAAEIISHYGARPEQSLSVLAAKAGIV
jgi:sugar/nucleoside kinase (ribokinase family)